MSGESLLHAHLETGTTTVARAWSVTRRDGGVLGFTDHDRDLFFDGVTYRADTGLSARAIQQSTGLAVDNTEALGALSATAIREEDIVAGRYDGAEGLSWLVNWADTAARKLIFRGHIGDMRRQGGAFHAELRGLTDVLNRPMGRVIQKRCAAVLGDARCGVTLADPTVVYIGTVHEVQSQSRVTVQGAEAYAPGWFSHGKIEVLDGAASGLASAIKCDRLEGGLRMIDLWEPLRADVEPGDQLRISAGCDGSWQNCKSKFGNLLNFQGFPDVPNEDWMTVLPSQSVAKQGGSRR
jgi:uncharacterized phage protein (TIGR02218 family)